MKKMDPAGVGVVARWFAWMMALGLMTCIVRADGFRNPPDTGPTLGRIGGRIAQVDDASAVNYNPANLTLLDRPQAMVSVLLGHSQAEFSSPAGSAETEDPWKALPSIYAAYPLAGGKSCVGVGVYLPYGRSTRWEKTSPFRYTAPYFAEMRLVDVNPVFSWRMTDSLSLAAGANVYWSDLEFRQIVPWSVMTGNPLAPDGEMRATGDGLSLGANLAAAWRPARHHQVALTYRSPFNMDYDGRLKLGNLPASPLLPLTPGSDFESTFKFPSIVGLGYGVEVTDTLRLEANIEWLQFSRFDRLDVDAGDNNGLYAGGQGNSINQDWKDTWTFGLGGDWQFTRDWMLRFGYLYLQSPSPDSTFMPSMLDADQSTVSLGLGYRRGAHALDVAYALGIFDKRQVSDNQDPSFNGDYDFSGYLTAVSYAYTF